MKVLITGANGYVGKSIATYLNSKQYHVTSLTREDFDLSSPDLTRNFFQNKYFDVVIHCAISGGSRLVQDSPDIMDLNLMMYYNLLKNHSNFDKLINLGSGAEIHLANTPYGLSKHVIRTSIIGRDNFYNIRIFNVFDQNELNTRFIKTSIMKYINKKEIEIFSNKRMDFFYMKDLFELINYYIVNKKPPKEIDCCYSKTYSLMEIAQLINSLDSYSVPITLKSTIDSQHYSGIFYDLGLKFIGLEKGIQEMYSALLNNKTIKDTSRSI